MSSIGLSQPGWTPRGGTPRVDWSNPLTGRLIMCLPGSMLPAVDLVGGRQFSQIGNPAGNYATTRGVGILCAANATGLRFYPATTGDPLRTNAPVTLGWAGEQLAAPDTYAPIAVMHHNDTNSDPYMSYGVDSLTQRISVSNTPTYTESPGTTTLAASKRQTAVCVNDGTNLEIWLNGIKEGTVGGMSSSIAYGSTANCTVAGGSAAQIAMSIVAIWRRALNAAEIARWHDNPLQLLKG